MLEVPQIILYSNCNKKPHDTGIHIHREEGKTNDWMGWSGVAQRGRAWCGEVQNRRELNRVE